MRGGEGEKIGGRGRREDRWKWEERRRVYGREGEK